MDPLKELIQTITPGMTVKVTNHDYIKDSGERTVDRVTSSTLFTKDSRGRSHYLQWEMPGRDYEVHGRTLKIFNPSHAYVHGNRAIVLELEFGEPEA